MTGWQIYENLISNKIKWGFFQVVAVSVLLYGCTTWTLTKHLGKELDRNCTRMLHAVEKILESAPYKTATVQPLTSHLTNHPSKMSKTCWSLLKKYEQTCELQSLTHRHTSVGGPTKTYIHQFCVETGCCQKDLEQWLIVTNSERVSRESVLSIYFDDNDEKINTIK